MQALFIRGPFGQFIEDNQAPGAGGIKDVTGPAEFRAEAAFIILQPIEFGGLISDFIRDVDRGFFCHDIAAHLGQQLVLDNTFANGRFAAAVGSTDKTQTGPAHPHVIVDAIRFFMG